MLIICATVLLVTEIILIKCQDQLGEIDKEKCPAWSYQCLHSKECIPQSWWCDGEADCGQYAETKDGNYAFDMTDEQGCSDQNMTAIVNERRCNRAGFVLCPGDKNITINNNTCIAYEQICDGHRHCPNGSDEPDGCKEKLNICWAVKCPPAQKCVIDFEGNPLCVCEVEDQKHRRLKSANCFDVTDCHEKCSHKCYIDRTRALWPLVTCKCQPGYLETNGGTRCLAINGNKVFSL